MTLIRNPLGDACASLTLFQSLSPFGMSRRFDHIDLRVKNLAAATTFYEKLLPALGFTRNATVEGWLQFEAGDADITEFFGVTESPAHLPNEVRIAFWAESNQAVDRLAEVARAAGSI